MAARLIVELDGWDTHGTKRAFADDRVRDSEILAQTGIPAVRITYAAFTASRPRRPGGSAPFSAGARETPWTPLHPLAFPTFGREIKTKHSADRRAEQKGN